MLKRSNDSSTLVCRLSMAALLGILFVILYGGVNYLTTLRHDVRTCFANWELAWPLWPWMLVPYCSLDLFFILAIVLPQSNEQLSRVCKRLALAIGLAAVCYLIWPLRLGFAPVEVPGPFGSVFRYLGTCSQHNAAPSLHIALGVIVFEAIRPRLRSNLHQAILFAWFLLIGASTLFTHQHHLIDLPTGLLLGAFCQWVFPLHALTVAGEPNRRIAIRYLFGATICAIPAIAMTGWFRWLAWPAGASLLMSLAYFGVIADVFRKADGVPWTSQLLFAPILILQKAVRWPYRCRSPEMVEIAPHVFLGARPTRRERVGMRERNIVAVVDLMCERPSAFRDPTVNTLAVPLLDWSLPTPAQSAEIHRFIEVRVARGQNVLIHCALGYFRTGIVATSYLLQSGHARSVDDALSQFKSARGRICCDPAFLNRLETLTGKLSEVALSAERPVRREWRASLDRRVVVKSCRAE